jgi:hypothetical protein
MKQKKEVAALLREGKNDLAKIRCACLEQARMAASCG